MNDYHNISISQVDDISTIRNDKGRLWQVTDRSWYGLSFSHSGELIYTHNGSHYTSKPGVAILLPKGGTYCLSCIESGDFPLINFQLEGEALPDSMFCLPIPADCTWESNYKVMERYSMRSKQKQYALKSLLYNILDQLFSEVDRNSLPGVLYTSVKYLEDHASDASLTNAQIAAQAGISEVYLRQLFKRHFDCSPHQYLLKKRMSIAHVLLRNPNIPIGEVAKSCGFSSIYQFSRSFHTAEGCSPSYYRSQHLVQLR